MLIERKCVYQQFSVNREEVCLSAVSLHTNSTAVL